MQPVESSLLRFLRLRQKECQYPMDIVSVRWLGGGELNYCFKNAYSMVREGEVSIVSGWLALPYDRMKQQQQFTQHWWNYNAKLGRYFDISPEIDEGAIYILDTDIGMFAATHNHRINSCVPSSVLYMHDAFYRLDAHGNGFKADPIENLDTETLFAPYLVTNVRHHDAVALVMHDV